MNIQWLRAAAAMAVVFFHASGLIEYHLDDTRYSTIVGREFGMVGVAIFFAISGALMADLIVKSQPGRFLIHRVLRIYPTLLIVSLMAPILVLGEVKLDMRALSLVPTGNNGNYRLGGVEWTLVYEVFFYVVLFLLAVAGKARWIVPFAIGWIALTLGFVVAGMADQGGLVPLIDQMPLQSGNIAFAAGLLIPALMRRGFFQPALAPVALGIVLVSIQLDFTGARIATSVASVLLVGIAAQSTSHLDGPISRSLTRLGDYSYALYLIHVPIQVFIYTTIAAPITVLWLIGIIAPVLLCIPVGIMDLALYKRLKRRFDARPEAVAMRTAWIFFCAYAIAAVSFAILQR